MAVQDFIKYSNNWAESYKLPGQDTKLAVQRLYVSAVMLALYNGHGWLVAGEYKQPKSLRAVLAAELCAGFWKSVDKNAENQNYAMCASSLNSLIDIALDAIPEKAKASYINFNYHAGEPILERFDKYFNNWFKQESKSYSWRKSSDYGNIGMICKGDAISSKLLKKAGKLLVNPICRNDVLDILAETFGILTEVGLIKKVDWKPYFQKEIYAIGAAIGVTVETAENIERMTNSVSDKTTRNGPLATDYYRDKEPKEREELVKYGALYSTHSKEELTVIRRLAEQGNALALIRLAHMHFYGASAYFELKKGSSERIAPDAEMALGLWYRALSVGNTVEAGFHILDYVISRGFSSKVPEVDWSVVKLAFESGIAAKYPATLNVAAIWKHRKAQGLVSDDILAGDDGNDYDKIVFDCFSFLHQSAFGYGENYPYVYACNNFYAWRDEFRALKQRLKYSDDAELRKRADELFTLEPEDYLRASMQFDNPWALNRWAIDILIGNKPIEFLSQNQRDEAKALFERAAERGERNSHFNLVKYFGDTLSREEKIAHLTESATKGNKDALKMLKTDFGI